MSWVVVYVRSLAHELCPARQEAPFDVEVFVSGFAYKTSGTGFNTRSGRAFLKIATCEQRSHTGIHVYLHIAAFAALPRLAAQITRNSPPPITRNISSSTEELLKDVRLPPPPDEMDANAEAEELERRLRELDVEIGGGASASTYPYLNSDASSASSSGYNTPRLETRGPVSEAAVHLMQKWSANLQARLHPFWSSALAARTVRLSLYATDPPLKDGAMEDDQPRPPLATQDVVTGPDGSFQATFCVSWKRLCTHPQGVAIAFSDRQREHDLMITADVLLPPSPRTPYQQPPIGASYDVESTATTLTSVPLTYTTIRVISDIDDTVKLADVLNGARVVFQNVFVKDLDESIIPGMADWYMHMWTRGVRFHYVVSTLVT